MLLYYIEFTNQYFKEIIIRVNPYFNIVSKQFGIQLQLYLKFSMCMSSFKIITLLRRYKKTARTNLQSRGWLKLTQFK